MRIKLNLKILLPFVILLLISSSLLYFYLNNSSNTNAQKGILKVSELYHESQPKITKMQQDVTEGPLFEKMFSVELEGNFTNGDLKAGRLDFSVLESGEKAWALRAFNSNSNQPVWEMDEVRIGS